MSKKPSIETPLKRAEGLGPAHGGVHHWLMQRITAVALLPLVVWFVGSVIALAHADRATFLDYFTAPINAVLMAVVVIFSFYHAALGLQEIIEDYVHGKFVKLVALLVVKFSLLLLGIFTVLAIIKMHLA